MGINMENRILIVIDMQNDFVSGVLGSEEAKAIVPNVKQKINEYIERGDTVIFTRDTHEDTSYLSSPEGKKLPIKHCIKGTCGWQICLETIPGVYEVIDKKTFGYSDWELYLDRELLTISKTNIELCGLDTDICVITNALIIKTLYPNAEIIVDANCCAGSTPEKHKAALEVMRSCQINVIGE